METKSHRTLYIVLVVVLVALMVVGAARHHQKKVNAEATAKATTFVTSLEQAGYPIRDRERAIEWAAETFGTDGGDLLADPQSAYYRAMSNFQLAGSGALSRPGVLDDKVFGAEYIALKVYRDPQTAHDFWTWYGKMKLDDVVAN
jgi:hypothetical protein